VEVTTPIEGGYSNGCHACEVEIDPEAGEVTILFDTAVNDFGRVLNVANVEGQVQGGVAQGIGQALLEHANYDRTSRQLLSGSLLDYSLPRVEHMPATMVFKDNGLVCTTDALGIKACGESGANGGGGRPTLTPARRSCNPRDAASCLGRAESPACETEEM
jgi:carbon-monoxide dehydrogenase large subunit